MVRTEAEEKQQEWEQAKTQLDRAIVLVSIADEDESRRLCLEIDESWIQLDRELQRVEKALLQGLAQQADVPLDDRLICIECSHARIQSALDQLPVKYGSPEETTTRRKELQVSNYPCSNCQSKAQFIMKNLIGVLQFHRVAAERDIRRWRFKSTPTS